MARKRNTKTVKDSLPNRHYEVVTVGGDSSAVFVNQFETMMGARESAGWLISRVDVIPNTLQDSMANTAATLRFQVAVGDQVAMLNADDDQVVATIDVVTLTVGAAGAYAMVAPWSWVGPVLIASKDVSCLVQCSDNTLPYQGQDFLFTIWYVWVQLDSQKYLDIIQAKGIL